MKRILSFALILSLLGGTSLWALRGPVNGRTYNRDTQELRGANQTDWVKAVGADSDGLLSTNIEVVVDYEYFTEASWPPFRKGYYYYAYPMPKCGAKGQVPGLSILPCRTGSREQIVIRRADL